MFRGLNFGAFVSRVLVGMVTVTPAFAAGDFDPVAANVSCVAASDRAPTSDIDAFLADPQTLLSENPGGGLELSNSVKVLASSSSKAYASIMALLGKASDPQKSAIGAGLARAFGECRDSQPDYAQTIGSDVGDMKGSNLYLAFSAANTDPDVASVNSSGGATSSAMGGGEVSADSSQKSGSNSRKFGAGDPTTNGPQTARTDTNPGFVDDYIADRSVSR